MTVQEQKAIIDDVLQNHTDQAKVSTLLATLTEDYVSVSSDLAQATQASEKIASENEQLRQANMKLFLQIGEPTKETKNISSEPTTPQFTSLFDEKGNLL